MGSMGCRCAWRVSCRHWCCILRHKAPGKRKKSDRENKEALKRLQPDHQHVQVSVVLSALVYESSEEKRRKAEAIVQKMVYDKRITVIQAYKQILYCRVGDTLYVVSRGTVLSCLSDLTADLTPGFQMDETGSYEACRGFSNSVKQDRLQYDEIFDDMVRRLQENPNLKLVFTGHSLGGAKSQLLIDKFRRKFGEARVTVYTFGSPFVGRKDMQQYYNENGISRRIFNIVNEKDPIPQAHRCLLAGLNAGKVVWETSEMLSTSSNVFVQFLLIPLSFIHANVAWNDVASVGNVIVLSSACDILHVGRWDSKDWKDKLKLGFSLNSHVIATYKRTVSGSFFNKPPEKSKAACHTWAKKQQQRHLFRS
ncbi:Lipase family protein [Angomonas deanei]|nr:Lipase family protein [Angomonas deanei]|eukprot:EPY15572.1 Lipase family protein [Angomonas deanei]